MDDSSLVISTFLVIIGFIVGILSSFFGIGGAFIVAPIINGLGVPITNAVATGLAFTLGVSSYGSLKHFFHKNIVLKVALFVGCISFVGVFIAKELLLYLDMLGIAESFVRISYVTMLLSLAAFLFVKNVCSFSKQNIISKIFEKLRSIPPFLHTKDGDKFSILTLVFAGLFIGLVKGFLGAGGFILFPVLIFALGIDCHKAAGTSLAILFITSIMATALYFLSGNVEIFMSILLIVGAFVGINIGVKALCNISESAQKKLYTVFLCLISVGIIIQQVNSSDFSLFFIAGSAAVISTIIVFKYYIKFRHDLKG